MYMSLAVLTWTRVNTVGSYIRVCPETSIINVRRYVLILGKAREIHLKVFFWKMTSYVRAFFSSIVVKIRSQTYKSLKIYSQTALFGTALFGQFWRYPKTSKTALIRQF